MTLWKPTQDRPAMKWLEELPSQSAGAEIGVWRGSFTHKIYRVVQPRVLHLIDPWLFQPQYPRLMFGGKIARSQADMDAIRLMYSEVQGRNPERMVEIRLASEAEE